MAVLKQENLVDMLTDGSANVSQVAQSLHGEDSEASDSAANLIENVKVDEEHAQIIPKTPEKVGKKRASVSNAITVASPKKAKVSPTEANPSKDMKTEVSSENIDIKSNVKKPRTPKGSKTGNANGVAKSAERKRGPNKAETTASAQAIPSSWDEASEADRELVRMKEAGKSWPEIREMWKNKTGKELAGSTLPNRYSRIKINLEHLEPGDEARLAEALARYESEKWKTISGYMESDGAKKYAPAFLMKEAKKVAERQANGTSVAAIGTMTGKKNETLTDKAVVKVGQAEQLGVPDENANTGAMALDSQDEGDDNELMQE
ncbi:hypothetical protein MMC26_001504 [Xylographa opegraphella]|nr:hypothetical protein [Xylographa opegraphella]